jgi:hypothetical protein
MRVFPKNKWRMLVTGSIPLLLAFLIFPPWWWGAQIRMQTAFLVHSRVTDKIDGLTFRDEWRFEQLLQQIDDESGVDIQFLLVPRIEGPSLEEYSVQQARARGVGRDADRRGLLFVYDTTGKQLRLEIGARLEGIVTDAFAGHLMREHARSFFGTGNPQLGILTTIMIVQHRLREGVLGEEFDPAFAEFIHDARRLALGGGASTAVNSDQTGPKFLNTVRVSSHDTRSYFSPQQTPEAAYQRYLQWLAVGGYATDVPLFTPLSQGYLGGLPMTRGFNNFLVAHEYNKAYRIEVRDSLALLYFTSTPLVGPHFLRQTSQGWVMDVFAEILNTRNYAGGPYSWGIVDSGDDFSGTFADRMLSVGPILRLAGGDNRPLPIRAYYGKKIEAPPSGPDVDEGGTPAERLTVLELARRITGHPSGKPLLVMLYYSQGQNSREIFPYLAEIARGCTLAGADVLALSIDDRPEYIRGLSRFLRERSADFPPIHLQRWPSGQLAGALDPLGFDIGAAFGTPLVAVRISGQVLLQAEGPSQVNALAEELVAACGSPRAPAGRVSASY